MEQKNKFYLTISDVDYEIHPHYKELKKEYRKENGQFFFRETLNGKITLWGSDYMLVKNASLDETIKFKVIRNNNVYAYAEFNKSDCTYDYFKLSVELKLSYGDKYSKIMDAYENTYDLIKLTPAITPLTLTKRGVVQIYIQGENVVSNYSGGTYWETEVNEQIDDEDALEEKYYFSKGPKYIEVDLQDFNYDINAVYRGLSENNVWNATSKREIDGEAYKMPCSIKFNKIYNASQAVPYGMEDRDILVLSDGTSMGVLHGSQSQRWFKFDTYRIEIYTGRDGTGTMIYQSNKLYGKDTNFTLSAGEGLYPMTKSDLPVSMPEPTPQTFNLGEYVIEYQIWGRLLCDVDQAKDGTQLYDLPYDDFVTPRRNYRKCIGLHGFDSNTSVVKIYQSNSTSEQPTAYGINDFGEYFVPPYSLYGQYYYPLARSSWANTSMWVMLDEMFSSVDLGFEAWISNYYKEYTLKNSYHISDVIKALLAKIDTNITHENTSEYSQFLYGHTGATASYLGGCDIYITQKTNILKGEYDQAAQKAEIKLKQVLNMLRDCFRCYWFIDEQNRFRIEHVSYFTNGFSYDIHSGSNLSLVSEHDKFNKKNILYCQQVVEFDKTDLASRYEFSWMDDVTDSMGNINVDILDEYIKKDKNEEITIDGFTSDIDYMLFLPDDFSNEGFALILADNDKKVPIVHQTIKSEKQFNRLYDIYPQNWFASFNQLIWHYMMDMPGYNISCNNIQYLHVDDIKSCIKHVVEFPAQDIVFNVYSSVTTELGSGYIESAKINVDTDLAELELRYKPS